MAALPLQAGAEGLEDAIKQLPKDSEVRGLIATVRARRLGKTQFDNVAVQALLASAKMPRELQPQRAAPTLTASLAPGIKGALAAALTPKLKKERSPDHERNRSPPPFDENAFLPYAASVLDKPPLQVLRSPPPTLGDAMIGTSIAFRGLDGEDGWDAGTVRKRHVKKPSDEAAFNFDVWWPDYNRTISHLLSLDEYGTQGPRRWVILQPSTVDLRATLSGDRSAAANNKRGGAAAAGGNHSARGDTLKKRKRGAGGE